MEPTATGTTMPSAPIGGRKRRIRRVFTRGFLRAILVAAPVAFLLPFLVVAFLSGAYDDVPRTEAALGSVWLLAGALSGILAAVLLPRHPVPKEGRHNGMIAGIGAVLAAYFAAFLLGRFVPTPLGSIDFPWFADAYLYWLIYAGLLAGIAGGVVGRQRAGPQALADT